MATQSPEKARGRKGEGAPYPLTRSRVGGDALRSLRRLIYRDQWEYLTGPASLGTEVTSLPPPSCILITSGPIRSAAILHTNYFRRHTERRHPAY